MSVKLLALRSGFTTLTVTYQYKDIILRSMVTVGAYHPLKVSYELTLRYADVAWELQVLCCLRLWNVTAKCISWTKDGLEVWLLWRTLLTGLPCTMLKGSLVTQRGTSVGLHCLKVNVTLMPCALQLHLEAVASSSRRLHMWQLVPVVLWLDVKFWWTSHKYTCSIRIIYLYVGSRSSGCWCGVFVFSKEPLVRGRTSSLDCGYFWVLWRR